MATPGTSQRPVRRIILRMSQAQAESVQREHPEPLEPPPAVPNAPGTPATIRKVPLNEQSDFRLPLLPVEGQDIVLDSGDPKAFMVRIGLIQGDQQRNQSNPILYYSPDRAVVTNIPTSGFSPIYHDENGYYSRQSAGQSAGGRQDTIRDINEFLDSQGLGGAQRSIAFYSEPLRF